MAEMSSGAALRQLRAAHAGLKKGAAVDEAGKGEPFCGSGRP